MSITKKIIISALTSQTDISYSSASSITNDFFEQIKNILASGRDVKFSGYGNFVIKEKKARLGRNPKTGKSALISARKVVTFKAGPKLKSVIAKP